MNRSELQHRIPKEEDRVGYGARASWGVWEENGEVCGTFRDLTAYYDYLRSLDPVPSEWAGKPLLDSLLDGSIRGAKLDDGQRADVNPDVRRGRCG